MSKTIKLRKEQVIEICGALMQMKGAYNIKLKYAIKKNKDILGPELETIQSVSGTDVKGFKEYQDEFEDLVKAFTPSEADKAAVIGTALGAVKVIADRKDDFKLSLSALDVKFKEAILQRKKEVEDYKEFLKDEIEIQVYEINPENIPDDIQQNIYEALFPILKDME